MNQSIKRYIKAVYLVVGVFISTLISQSVKAKNIDYYIKIEQRLSGLSSNDLNDCKMLDNSWGENEPIGAIILSIRLKKIVNNSLLKKCGYEVGEGQSLKIAKYPDLYNAILCDWGCTDEKHFNLPDFNHGYKKREN